MKRKQNRYLFAPALALGLLSIMGAGRLAAQPDAERVLIERARSLEARGLSQVAAQVWQQVLLADPNNLEALAALAREAKANGNEAQAQSLLERLRKLTPGNPEIARIESTPSRSVQDARLAQAGKLAAAGSYAQAMEIYRQVYGDRPPAGEAALSYYDTEAATEGGQARAAAGLAALAKQFPADPRYKKTLGRILTYNPKTRTEGEAILREFPQDPQAQAALRQALVWDVRNPAAESEVRQYLRQHNDRELAAGLEQTEVAQSQAARSGLAQTPRESAAYAALHAGRLDDAERGFLAIVSGQPDNPRALAGLGFVRMKQNNFPEAVQDFEAAQQHGLKGAQIRDALEEAKFWRSMSEGTAALSQNRLGEAESGFRAALTLRPRSPEAMAGLAGALLKDRQSAEAADLCAQWLKIQPGSVPAWKSFFFAQVQKGELQQAIETVHRFPSAVRSALLEDPEYLNALVGAYRAAGDDSAAQETLARALHLPFPSGGERMTAAARLPYAELLLSAERYAQAAALYQDIVAGDPANPGAWQGLVTARHQMHDDAAAVSAFERMPSQISAAVLRDPGFLSILAPAYRQQGRLDQAEALLERAQKITADSGRPLSSPLLLQMASLEAALGRPEAAYALYARVLDGNPRSADAWMGILSVLNQMGRAAQAVEDLQRMPPEVQSRLASDPRGLQVLGGIYAAGGNSRAALAIFLRLQSIDSAKGMQPPAEIALQTAWLLFNLHEESDLYRQLMQLGARQDLKDSQRLQVQKIWVVWSARRAGEAVDSGNPRQALTILNAAREALAGNAEAAISLAGGYLKADRPKEALACYRSVDLSRASSVDLQGAIGSALAARDFKQAEAWLRQALEQYPRDPQVLGLAAKYEQIRGDRGLARRYWEASLAASPRTDAVDRLARILKEDESHRGSLPAPETLAALLAPDAEQDRPGILLPGQSLAQEATPQEASAQEDRAFAQPDFPRQEENSVLSPTVRSPQDAGETLGNYQPKDSLKAQLDLPAQAAAANAQELPQASGRGDFPAFSERSAEAPEPKAFSTTLPSTVPALSGSSDVPRRNTAMDALATAQVALLSSRPESQPTNATPVPQTDRELEPDTSQEASGGGLSAQPIGDAFSSKGANQTGAFPQPVGQPYDAGKTVGLPPAPRNLLAPGASTASSSATATNAKDLSGEAEKEVAAIDGSYSAWVGGTGLVNHRTGTPGFDQLAALEAPFEISAPFGVAARLTVIERPVVLSAGSADGTSTLQFGSLPAGSKQPQQLADGVAAELQLATPNFAARVGDTPYGFLVRNFTGGIHWQPSGGPLTLDFTRDSVKETQLSYSGLRDPGSAGFGSAGNIWGGVVANTGDAQWSHGDAASGFYAGIGGQYLTGYHVLTNSGVHGVAGAYWRVLTVPDEGTLTLGTNFFGMHYAHNLRYFTYGQGGYFSPEAFLLTSVPFTWTGHYGPQLHYRISGSIGAQSLSEAATPFFPLDPNLQQAYNDPYIPAKSSIGANYDLRSEFAYSIENHWYVGGFLDFNNTRDYQSQSAGFFVRYLFRPQPASAEGPTGIFPHDGFRPLLVP